MPDWGQLRRQIVGEYDARFLPPKLDIPMMPAALMDFLRHADDPEMTATDLGKCIERDPGLTCELLKYVNSSAIGTRHKASTPQRAITVLGVHRSALVLMTAAIQKALKPRQLSTFDYDGFTASNLERALFARHFAEAFHADVDLAFAGGMLVDCLIPKLFVESPALYAKYASAHELSKPLLTEVEQKAQGWTHASSAAQIMLGWGFPDDLVCCIAMHHQTYKVFSDPLVRSSHVAAVAMAAMIPDTPMLQVPSGLDVLRKLHKVIPQLDGATVAAAVDTELQAMAIPMGRHLTAATRMQRALAEVT